MFLWLKPIALCPRKSYRRLKRAYLALWLGYIEWMCWPSNTCDWSCKFSTCSGSLRPRVSAPGSQTANISCNAPSPRNSQSCMKRWKNKTFKNASPGLNSTMAFRQANSVGSTARTLKWLKISSRMRRSAVGTLFLDCCAGTSFVRDSRGQVSRGRDHWMAHRINISFQASSSRITCRLHRYIHQAHRESQVFHT